MFSHQDLNPLLVLLAMTLAGCAGSGEGLDANGRPSTGPSNGGGAITADFQSIQDHVFTPICSVCHVGGGAPLGLRLDAASSYDLLVNVPSGEVPSLMRVAPGNPDNSYLVQKIEGHAAVGGRMPLGGAPLSADQIAAIRQWVSDGALRPAAIAASFKLRLTVPADQDLLDQVPAQVLLGFTRDLDLTRVEPDSVRIERLVAGIAQVLPARLTSPDMNPQVLLLTPAVPMQPGRYRVWLRASPGRQITDLAAHGLESPASRGEEMLIAEFEVVTP